MCPNWQWKKLMISPGRLCTTWRATVVWYSHSPYTAQPYRSPPECFSEHHYISVTRTAHSAQRTANRNRREIREPLSSSSAQLFKDELAWVPDPSGIPARSWTTWARYKTRGRGSTPPPAWTDDSDDRKRWKTAFGATNLCTHSKACEQSFVARKQGTNFVLHGRRARPKWKEELTVQNSA